MTYKHFPNKISFSIVLFFFGLVIIILCSQECFSEQNTNIYEDDNVGVIINKVERTDEYPSEWKLPGYRYRSPKEGHDYLVVHFTIKKIVNVHVVGFAVRMTKNPPYSINKGKYTN